MKQKISIGFEAFAKKRVMSRRNLRNGRTITVFTLLFLSAFASYFPFLSECSSVRSYGNYTINVIRNDSPDIYASFVDRGDAAWRPPDDSYALIVGNNGVVWKFDGTTFWALLTGTASNLYGVDWKPDGSYALIVGEDTVMKFNGTAFESIPVPPDPDPNVDWTRWYGVDWKPDGSYALIVGSKHWDGSSHLQPTAAIFNGTHVLLQNLPLPAQYDWGLIDVAWKPDGSYALIAGDGMWKFDGQYFDNIVPYDDYDTEPTRNMPHLANSAVSWRYDGLVALVTGHSRLYRYDGAVWTVIMTISEVAWPAIFTSVRWQPGGTQALIVGMTVGPPYGPLAVVFDGTEFSTPPSESTKALLEISWRSDGLYATVTGNREISRFAPSLSVDLSVEPVGLYSAETATVRVHVDAGNDPLEGAGIMLSSDRGGTFSLPTDDGNGNYSAVYNPPAVDQPKVVTITATALAALGVGYNKGSASFQITVSPSPTLVVSASSIPGTCYSGGRVSVYMSVNDGMNPVLGASISLTSLSGGTFSNLTEEGNGQYSCIFSSPSVIAPASIEISITASKYRYEPGSTKLHVTVKPLEPGRGSLHIFVKTGASQDPVMGALLVFTSTPSGQPSLNTTTDKNGFAQFENIVAGTYLVQASEEGFLVQNKSETILAGQITADTITVIMIPEFSGWLILVLFMTITLSVIALKKRIPKIQLLRAL